MEGSSSSRYGGGFVRLGAPRAAAQLALHAHNSSKDDAAHLSAYSFINPGGGAYIYGGLDRLEHLKRLGKSY